MIYTIQTKKALKLSFEAHKNQVDKSGLPYVYHPFQVALKMYDEDTTIVALLHDVVEDSAYTIEDIEKLGFKKEVIDAIRLLTHDKNDDYFSYVEKIKTNNIATKVKIADLENNSIMDRLDTISEKDIARFNKYQKCLKYLKDEIKDLRENME